MNKTALFASILFFIVGCSEEVNDNCIKGIIIGINQCIEDSDNPLNSRLIKIFDEIDLGDTVTINNQHYSNVVQVYDFLNEFDSVEDTLYFQYRIPQESELIQPVCITYFLWFDVPQVIVTHMSTNPCNN